MKYSFNKALLILCLLPSLSNAQTADVIATGRPGQSIGGRVVGTNILQIQSGLDFSITEAGTSKNESLSNNNVFRYGIDEKYEVSAVLDADELNSSERELGNFLLGGRVSLTDKADGYIPKLCFQARLQLIDSAGEQNEDLKFATILAGVFDLKSFGSLTSNLLINNLNREELEFNGYTLSWSRNYNDKISYFIEFFSSETNDTWYMFWDTGIGYTVHKDLAVDFSLGSDLEEDFDVKFFSVGFSWRTGRL